MVVEGPLSPERLPCIDSANGVQACAPSRGEITVGVAIRSGRHGQPESLEWRQPSTGPNVASPILCAREPGDRRSRSRRLQPCSSSQWQLASRESVRTVQPIPRSMPSGRAKRRARLLQCVLTLREFGKGGARLQTQKCMVELHHPRRPVNTSLIRATASL